MSSCELHESCPLLTEDSIVQMPKLVITFEERYCRGNFEQCARYRVAKELDRRHVPDLMLPTQIEWADQIIKEQKEQLDVGVPDQDSSIPPKN